jgi:dTDP-4-amino-4,6-dideoxygalactose transaminase
MPGGGMFDKILEFEKELAEFCGAPYAIMTDCCTHAIELCLRHDRVRSLKMTPYTYISIAMLMHKLGIHYVYSEETKQEWSGEYEFVYTRVWDSARRLEPDMYQPGKLQCLSFGHDKPLQIGRGGAILLDDRRAYDKIIRMRYDGRDLNISPWIEQKNFVVGYHYRPTIEEAVLGLKLLKKLKRDCPPVKHVDYPDLRTIKIKE